MCILYQIKVILLQQTAIESMRGYKALLDQLSLHNSTQIQELRNKKISMGKLVQNLDLLDGQMDTIINQVKYCLTEAQNNAIAFLSDLNLELEQFLTAFKHQKTDSFVCGCGFKSKDQKQYVKHIQGYIRHWRHLYHFLKNSTHIVTMFGNTVRHDDFAKCFIQRDCENLPQLFAQKQIFKEKQMVKSKTIKEVNMKESVQVSDDCIQKTQKTKIKQACPEEKKQSSTNELTTAKKQSSIKDDNEGQYFCGECAKYFGTYRTYSLHIRVHDYLVHPNSSHIIIRKKNKPAEAMHVRAKDQEKQRFICPCSNKNYSRDEFVTHVFKWHKGITPRK